ncbi:denitrification regulatory protein NirQ [Marinobacterium zhoushanense]|uniref:Denitrification regulatory protein NirQ n=1 Tax=Marinobacterium zhoushanense TaxID=1679163 RepID=A0ABQ1KBQ5_9GAMM|nr:CbbQ/NirQ/NorQ/GpvN family protein [Marinobacterium zhoushanense]GGB91062.1 denitrification regulatory protein NirQ [Marinobacterium zhoushanense]
MIKSINTTARYLPQGNEVDLFHHAAASQLPVLLKGPTGCGKTRFVQYMAEQLNRPLITIACHDDLTASDLVGRHLIGAEGTYWQDGPLTRAVREGAICYLDEVVEARKDTTVVLHPLSDHRRELPIDRTGELLKAHHDFMLVISYNPGYQNLMKGLKPSTRQRFVGLSFDYPTPEREVVILCQEAGIDKQTATQLVALGNDLRRLKDQDLEEVASTRLLIYTALMICSGCSVREACRACLAEPLSDDSETLAAIDRLISCYF